MSFHTKTLSICALTLLILGATYVAYPSPAPTFSSPEIQQHFEVTIAIAGIVPAHAFTVTEGATALELVQMASEQGFPVITKEYVGLGAMVETIGLLTNGTDGKYWTYTVNGTSAAVGADAYMLEPHDAIEWTFAVPEDY
ncbi:MAG: DUF4430 domain-containing protein [Minisyncoccia bacterium]